MANTTTPALPPTPDQYSMNDANVVRILVMSDLANVAKQAEEDIDALNAHKNSLEMAHILEETAEANAERVLKIKNAEGAVRFLSREIDTLKNIGQQIAGMAFIPAYGLRNLEETLYLKCQEITKMALKHLSANEKRAAMEYRAKTDPKYYKPTAVARQNKPRVRKPKAAGVADSELIDLVDTEEKSIPIIPAAAPALPTVPEEPAYQPTSPRVEEDYAAPPKTPDMPFFPLSAPKTRARSESSSSSDPNASSDEDEAEAEAAAVATKVGRGVKRNRAAAPADETPAAKRRRLAAKK